MAQEQNDAYDFEQADLDATAARDKGKKRPAAASATTRQAKRKNQTIPEGNREEDDNKEDEIIQYNTRSQTKVRTKATPKKPGRPKTKKAAEQAPGCKACSWKNPLLVMTPLSNVLRQMILKIMLLGDLKQRN